jgi:ribosomal protein S18 acetylase RimI-like enzyme
MAEISYLVRPPLTSDQLYDLYDAAWPGFGPRDFRPKLAHSLTYVAAFAGDTLVGFVHVAWDGELHGFVLDPAVHPAYQRRGIGTELLRQAALAAAQAGLEWLHVDYAPHLAPFYQGCGYVPTPAGVLNLRAK